MISEEEDDEQEGRREGASGPLGGGGFITTVGVRMIPSRRLKAARKWPMNGIISREKASGPTRMGGPAVEISENVVLTGLLGSHWGSTKDLSPEGTRFMAPSSELSETEGLPGQFPTSRTFDLQKISLRGDGGGGGVGAQRVPLLLFADHDPLVHCCFCLC